MKARYLMAVLASMGMGLIYGLKVGLHVVIVIMVNNTAIYKNSDHEKTAPSSCGETSSNTTIQNEDGPFEWSTTIQGFILSSYFLGYMVAQLPGGRIAESFSAKWVFFFAVAINVVCSLISPIVSKLHYGGLLVIRILQGIGGGVTFPACHVLLAHWAPPKERSVMSSIVYAGTALGTVIFMYVSGVIGGALGWEAVFYIEGGISGLWLLLWAFLVADTPEEQKFISEEEREFIATSLETEVGGKHTRKLSVPWKEVMTSPPFIAIFIAHTCNNWGWYMVLIELPQYMKNVLHFEIKENSLLTALPFLLMWLFSLILSKILDYSMTKNVITTTAARKIATLIASVIPLICFIVLCFIECHRAIAVSLMTIAIMSIGGMFCGFLSNHIDIAPNYAGTLMALTNTVATIPGIIVPIVVGKLTHSDPSIGSWRIVFYITIGLYAIEIITYSLLASGEVQKWNRYAYDDEPSESQPLKTK